MLAVRFRLHTDFDLVTELQRELQLAAAPFTRPAPALSGASVATLVDEKLALIEEFKAQQAVVRNSIAISEEMMTELWGTDAPAPGVARAPDALLRAGIIAQERNMRTRARELYQRVRQSYPSSDAAQEAARRLRTIGG